MSAASGQKQLATIIKYEMLKFLRGRKFFIILAIIGIISIAMAIIPPIAGNPYPNAKEFIEFFANFVNIIIIIVVTLFGADAIVYDFEKGTAFVLYPNPVRRRTIFAGKFISSLIMSVAIVVVYYMIGIALDVAINGTVPFEVFYSMLLAIAYMATLMSVTFLISTTMRSTLAASVLVFALFFLVFPMMGSMITIVGIEPWFIITSMPMVIGDIFTTPFPQTIEQDMGAFKMLVYHPSVRMALTTMVAYTVPAFALAYRQFIKKELQ